MITHAQGSIEKGHSDRPEISFNASSTMATRRPEDIVNFAAGPAKLPQEVRNHHGKNNYTVA